jgi:hypothetical protein
VLRGVKLFLLALALGSRQKKSALPASKPQGASQPLRFQDIDETTPTYGGFVVMSITPIAVSDSQLVAIFTAARPLARGDVEGFLEAVAEQLRGRAIVGDGDVHRAVMVAQKLFFVPPTDSHRHMTGKYDRVEHR